MSSLEQRRALLTAALGFMQLERWNEPKPPAMMALVRWMDSWTGIGAVVVGMAAQGCDLQLTEYAGKHWRAIFFVTGMVDREGLSLRADPMARGAARGVGGAAR